MLQGMTCGGCAASVKRILESQVGFPQLSVHFYFIMKISHFVLLLNTFRHVYISSCNLEKTSWMLEMLNFEVHLVYIACSEIPFLLKFLEVDMFCKIWSEILPLFLCMWGSELLLITNLLMRAEGNINKTKRERGMGSDQIDEKILKLLLHSFCKNFVFRMI